MKKRCVGIAALMLAGLAWSVQAAIIDENFTGGSLDQLGWYNKDGGWVANNAAGRAEFNGAAANGWQWMGKTFDAAQVTNGWQLDFDYEWQWGDGFSSLQFRADIVGDGSNYDSASGYGLIVNQGGANSFQLVRLDSGSYVPGALLSQGNGYSDAGCQWGSPVWKSVRLTWNADTNTLTAYKKDNGTFVEVASASDASYTYFSNLRFTELQTYGEKTWITNVHFASVPEPASMVLLTLGGLLLRRNRLS